MALGMTRATQRSTTLSCEGYSWGHGSSSWFGAKCERFANDPVSLIEVRDRANGEKRMEGPLE